LFICFVEFFASVSSLKKEDWEKVSKFECEKDLRKKFVCVVCFFAEFSVFENVHFDCEFCDSILIFSLLFVFESVASSIFSSTLENFANENQSSASFSLVRKKESEIEKEVVFTSCLFVCSFVDSSIESLLVFIFSISELSFLILFVWSLSAFLNSKKYEIVRRKEKKFLNVKTVTKSNVSDFCETRSSNLLLLNKSCVEIIEIEKKEEKKRNRFCFEFFAIDFVLNCFHVKKIESLQCVVSIIEENQNLQKKNSKKKKKKKCLSKRSINIERVDQSRMRMMRIWLKKFLKKEKCRDQRRTKKEQFLS
jgi:hypothetical protein